MSALYEKVIMSRDRDGLCICFVSPKLQSSLDWHCIFMFLSSPSYTTLRVNVSHVKLFSVFVLYMFISLYMHFRYFEQFQ